MKFIYLRIGNFSKKNTSKRKIPSHENKKQKRKIFKPQSCKVNADDMPVSNSNRLPLRENKLIALEIQIQNSLS